MLNSNREYISFADSGSEKIVRFPNPLASRHSWQLGNLTNNLDDGDDEKDDMEYGENMVKKAHICTAKLGLV